MTHLYRVAADSEDMSKLVITKEEACRIQIYYLEQMNP